MQELARPNQFFPVLGAETSKDGMLLTANSFEMGVNVQLDNGLLRTRDGVRQVPLAFVNEQSEPDFHENVQGVLVHNPSKGQSGQIFAQNKTFIIASIGGKKFSMYVTGEHGQTQADITDVTNGLDQDKFAHLVWAISAENYSLFNDGFSNMWIWDTVNNAFASPGYISDPAGGRPNSKLPNGGTVLVYAHGRVCVVVNARKIIVGDQIHKASLTDSVNILDATEATYWSSGRYFIPPSSMSDIIAAEVLPLKDTTHGHGEILFHCRDGGIFSLDINIFPREKTGTEPGWEDKEMTKHAMLHTAATGPLAIALVEGDQIFRSHRSLDSMVSAAAESQLLGSPSEAVGEPLQKIFDLDFEPYLKFASVINHARRGRVMCTADPSVRGRFWFHRALVSINTNPTGSERSNYAFEGLHVYPPEIRNITQVFNGRFAGNERVFFIGRDHASDPRDETSKLVELDPTLEHDVILSDGVPVCRAIDAQVMSRKMHFDTPLTEKQVSLGKIFFRDIVGELKWGVWLKTDIVEDFKWWWGGTINTQATECDTICMARPYNHSVVLPDAPEIVNPCRWVQTLVRWTGRATYDSLVVKTSAGVSLPEGFHFEEHRKVFVNAHKPSTVDHMFDPYDYSKQATMAWHELIGAENV